MKKLTATILCVLFLFPTCVFAKKVTPSVSPIEKFKEDLFFPKNNFESITPTAIKGVYEVYTGNQIYYYMPKDNVIFYGPLISKDGVNITRESSLKKMAQKDG